MNPKREKSAFLDDIVIAILAYFHLHVKNLHCYSNWSHYYVITPRG